MNDQVESAPLTLQQAADLATRGLLKQMRRSRQNDGAWRLCLYSDELGGHCAIGFMLTPEQQAEVGDFKGGVDELIQHFSSVSQRLSLVERCDLEYLQSIHDHLLPESWEATLREFYSQHKLIFPTDL